MCGKRRRRCGCGPSSFGAADAASPNPQPHSLTVPNSFARNPILHSLHSHCCCCCFCPSYNCSATGFSRTWVHSVGVGCRVCWGSIGAWNLSHFRFANWDSLRDGECGAGEAHCDGRYAVQSFERAPPAAEQQQQQLHPLCACHCEKGVRVRADRFVSCWRLRVVVRLRWLGFEGPKFVVGWFWSFWFWDLDLEGGVGYTLVLGISRFMHGWESEFHGIGKVTVSRVCVWISCAAARDLWRGQLSTRVVSGRLRLLFPITTSGLSGKCGAFQP